MASGGRAKRFRGNHTHGRGKKAGRGAGLKGGRGRAGAHKHRRVMLQQLGGKHPHMAAKPWGRIGFKAKNSPPAAIILNVGDLPLRFPGAREIDLAAAGYTKLLGSGGISTAVTVKVDRASPSAQKKVEAAGGKVVLLVEPPAPKAAAKPGAPAAGGKPAAAGPAGGKPQGGKPADKPGKPPQAPQ
jgi:large subunit ribosomal protein L15